MTADGGGYFEIGVNPQDESLTPSVVSRFYTSEKKYSLKDLTSFRFGNVNIFAQVTSTLIDTGSSMLIVPGKVLNSILADIDSVCQRMGNCQVMQ
jgi:hypothetical protein